MTITDPTMETPPVSPQPPIPPPPPIPKVPETPEPRLAWSPIAIGLLGVLFSPVWAGAMAALNGYRLGLSHLWRPVTVGLAAVLIDVLVPFDSYLFTLGIYVAALVAIWILDLAPQAKALESNNASDHASLKIPCLIGSPLALVVVVGFLISPLIPAFPRDVCQKFLDARTAASAKRYVCESMFPLIEYQQTIERLKSKVDKDMQPPINNSLFQLTDEAYAEPEIGGYLVGWYCELPQDDGTAIPVEGLFHLVIEGNDWKISEWVSYEQAYEGAEIELYDLTQFWQESANNMAANAPQKSSTQVRPRPTETAADKSYERLKLSPNPSFGRDKDQANPLLKPATIVASKGIWALLGTKGAKVLGVVMLGLFGGLYHLIFGQASTGR